MEYRTPGGQLLLSVSVPLFWDISPVGGWSRAFFVNSTLAVRACPTHPFASLKLQHITIHHSCVVLLRSGSPFDSRLPCASWDSIVVRDTSDIHCVADLLWHLPTGMIDRRQVSRVSNLVEGETATVLLKVSQRRGSPEESDTSPHENRAAARVRVARRLGLMLLVPFGQQTLPSLNPSRFVVTSYCRTKNVVQTIFWAYLGALPGRANRSMSESIGRHSVLRSAWRRPKDLSSGICM